MGIHEMAKSIAFLNNLRALYIDQTKITDEAAKVISRLNNLSILSIGYNKITDEGAEYPYGEHHLVDHIVVW
jgi:Leucine-rich repeat (LRR) protein